MPDEGRESTQEDAVFDALQRHDPHAAQFLVEVFGDRVYGLSLRILCSAEDAQEACQETFLKIWEKWPTFRGRARFSSWVYRIAANCAYMRLRKARHRTREISLELLDRDPGAEEGETQDPGHLFQRTVSPDEALQSRELFDLVEQAVEELTPGYRTAYVLKDVEDMPLKDIADAMELSEAAVKSRIHRARLDVRQRLRHFLGDIPKDMNREEGLP